MITAMTSGQNDVRTIWLLIHGGQHAGLLADRNEKNNLQAELARLQQGNMHRSGDDGARIAAALQAKEQELLEKEAQLDKLGWDISDIRGKLTGKDSEIHFHREEHRR